MSYGDDRPTRPDDAFPPNPYAAPLAVEEDARRPISSTGELRVNPWTAILTEPTATIRQIVNYNPAHQVLLISALLGSVGLFGANDGTDESAALSLLVLFPLALVVGPILGILFIYIFSAILGWSAKLIGGVSTYEEMRAAYTWSAVPNIWAAPITILVAVATSPEFAETVGEGRLAFAGIGAMASLVVGVWSFVISLNTIAEVNQFSRMKAFGAMMLPGLILAALMIVVLIAIFAVRG